MAPSPETIAHQLETCLAGADPQRVDTARAAQLVKVFARIQRLGGAGVTLFADRAAASRAWADEGHLTPSSWLADVAKAPMGEALATMETSKALAEMPATADELKRGELSGHQAREVARAVTKDPTRERELLDLARTDSLKRLQERARQMRSAAASKEDEAARYLEIHRRRYLRHYLDHDGAFRLEARLAPDAGARVASAIQAEADAEFREARTAGRREPSEAYRADALVALVTAKTATAARPGTASGSRSAPRTDTIVFRVDGKAFRRGYALSGELCEISGFGPVPVATVRRQLPQSFVKIVVKRGVDVVNVCHAGRTVPAHLQTALDERDVVCVVPGCDVACGLENHHWQENYSDGGATSLENLARVCARHHDLITYGGWRLLDGPRRWRFVPPPDEGSGQQRLEDTG